MIMPLTIRLLQDTLPTVEQVSFKQLVKTNLIFLMLVTPDSDLAPLVTSLLTLSNSSKHDETEALSSSELK